MSILSNLPFQYYELLKETDPNQLLSLVSTDDLIEMIQQAGEDIYRE